MSRLNKNLLINKLLDTIRLSLNAENFKSNNRNSYSWEDCIMSGLAIFGLKFASMLQFEKNKGLNPNTKHNLRKLYGAPIPE